MKQNFPAALKKVLAHEGGWADHPKDPGGATMKGVTLYNYRRYVNPKATKRDLRNISDAELEMIYKKHYWDVCRCDELPPGLDYVVFDFGVNSGPGRSAKFLQRILPVKVDGRIGPKTIQAVYSYDNKSAIKLLCDNRLAWLKTLKHWPTFGKGWSRRVAGVRKAGLAMSKKLGDGIGTSPSPEKTPEKKSLIDLLILIITKLLSKG